MRVGAKIQGAHRPLVIDPDDRQSRLETVDVGTRADRVGGEIATPLTRLTASEGPAN